jgi:cell wall-associated NlpC family hydrolase
MDQPEQKIYLMRTDKCEYSVLFQLLIVVITVFPLQARSQNNVDLIKKYSAQLKVSENEIARFRPLYAFIDKWIGTPYRYGGCTTKGIDCSCFVMMLFDNVFNIAIKRTSFTQFYDNDVSLFKSRKQYSTGDLIFFKTNINRATSKNRVTHVGLYLANGYFVQSSSEGVNIANLETGYWKNHFVAAGRLKESYYQRAGLRVPDGAVEENTKMFVAEEDSDFDPPLIPESYDSIIKKYAALLNMPADRIRVPEILVFLDSLGKKPFTASDCLEGSIRSTCMISAMYQSVFNVKINARSLAVQADSTVDILKRSDQLSEGDIVYFKSLPYLKEYNQAGIFLYNNRIAYIDGERLIIASITEDNKLKSFPKMYARLQDDVLRQAGQNLTKRRRAEDSLAGILRNGAANANLVIPVDSTEKKEVIPLQAFSTPLAETIQKGITPFREPSGGNYSPIVVRYAKQFNVNPSYLKDPLLYLFADKWQNTPLRNRGCTDKRMSHECFAIKYFAEVYDQPIELSDISALNGVYADPVKDGSPLEEGDILFFGTKSAGVNKAEFLGIYLGGKYFLSLSPFTSKVSICETGNPLYQKKFISVARPVR